ncbi:hypothetical protein TNCV_3846971 [Trichonephila clavipes]|nr:hypothetical protein TNCV_3846971 [Trichonephila clavipes]
MKLIKDGSEYLNHFKNEHVPFENLVILIEFTLCRPGTNAAVESFFSVDSERSCGKIERCTILDYIAKLPPVEGWFLCVALGKPDEVVDKTSLFFSLGSSGRMSEHYDGHSVHALARLISPTHSENSDSRFA